jgi:hypothetical protein
LTSKLFDHITQTQIVAPYISCVFRTMSITDSDDDDRGFRLMTIGDSD